MGEVVKLRSEDIDSERTLIHIKGAKGRKDRYTMLSQTALQALKQYQEQYKPVKWLFEGARAGRYLSTRTVVYPNFVYPPILRGYPNQFGCERVICHWRQERRE